MRPVLVLMTLAFVTPHTAVATTYTVCADGTGDYVTIQEAVDVALPGDSIHVCPGDYPEDVVIHNNLLHLAADSTCSGNGAAPTTNVQSFLWTTDSGLSGGSLCGFRLVGSIAGEFHQTFTISHCQLEGGGSLSAPEFTDGVFVRDSSVNSNLGITSYSYNGAYVARCTFTDCSLSSGGSVSLASVRDCVFNGGGMVVSNELNSITGNQVSGGTIRLSVSGGFSAADVGGNVVDNASIGIHVSVGADTYLHITDNTVTSSDIGMQVQSNHQFGVDHYVRRNEIRDCETALLLVATGYGALVTEDNLIWECTDGIVVESVADSMLVSNNTIDGCVGDGIRYTSTDSYVGGIQRNVVTNSGAGVTLPAGAGTASISCNDVWSNGVNWIGVPDQTGANANFSANPRFCDPANDDYALGSNSPCLPVNSSCGELVGALGEGCSDVYLTHVVYPDGTGDHPTIQDAVTAASHGDVVELTDGVFSGTGNRDIDLLGKLITVRSRSGDPRSCIIDCEGSAGDPHRGFEFRWREVLQGVTIRNGYGSGGGARCFDSDAPSILDCVFDGNRGGSGAAIFFESTDGLVRNCTIVNNSSSDQTYPMGGIFAYQSNLTVENCIFAWNDRGSVFTLESERTVTCCAFWENGESSPIGEGNFDADPLFCDAEGQEYSLRDDSPCLPGQHPDGMSCGLIGAQSVGCSVDTISVIPPSGPWFLNTVRAIEWIATPGIDSVRIELSSSGPTGPWEQITTAASEGDGRYLWTVAGTPSFYSYLRVSDATDGLPVDVSDAPVILAGGPPQCDGDANINVLVTQPSYMGCEDPAFDFIDQSNCGDLAGNPHPGLAYVWVVASHQGGYPNGLAALQFGLDHTLDVSEWSLCTGGTEYPDSAWPSSGTGNKVTWANDCYNPPAANARIGFLQVSDGATGSIGVRPHPSGSATYFDCPWNHFTISPQNLGGADLTVGTSPICENNGGCDPEEWGLSCLPNDECDWRRNGEVASCGDCLVAVDMYPSTPRQYALYRCRPNPFNPRTNIGFDLSSAGRVFLEVFDVMGRRVHTLVAGKMHEPGQHRVAWNGRDDDGRVLASGTYFYRLRVGGFEATERMTLLK